jgi:hypothetical protein
LSQGTKAGESRLGELRSGSILARYLALKSITAERDYISDLKLQRKIVELLIRESNDSNWGGKDEFSQYEQYYSALLDAVQHIASECQSPPAWAALLRANFDDSSSLARWISSQPESMLYLLEMVNDKSDVVRGRTCILLARELARCHALKDEGVCAGVNSHADEVLSVLRSQVKDAQSPWTQLGAVRSLGLCGEEQDIMLLKKLDDSPDKAFTHYVNRSIDQIKSRRIREIPSTQHESH